MDIITVERKILEKNDAIAAELRREFRQRKIFTVNLISSPGSGKTSIIEKLHEYIAGEIKFSVITGDLQTDNDARRIGALKIPVIQIITNGSCHLEAALVRDAFSKLNGETDLLIIENVGNLVCPAGFDLGEEMKIVILSTTEGDDKPLKYPVVFRNSSVLIINKTDLLPYLKSIPETMIYNAKKINPSLKVFETSCTSGEGFAELAAWLKQKVNESEN
jgi:hydrogenase nickel incorporation protein HypB